MEENDWSNLLVDAVVATGDDASTSSASSTIPAVYIGNSAGAIMAGKYIETVSCIMYLNTRPGSTKNTSIVLTFTNSSLFNYW